MTKTEQDAIEALALMDELLEAGCTLPSECGGYPICFYCMGDDAHDERCPYIRACELRDRKPERI